jgi:predicted RNA-binding Zn ribbon-like protein
MPVGQLKINAIRLVGGLAVLDYLNTCDGRRPGTTLHSPVDNLSSIDDIVHWCLHARLIDTDTHRHYVQMILVSPWAPISAFKQLINFRERLYQLLLPVAMGEAVDLQRLQALNECLMQTASRRMLVTTPSGVIWCWRRGESVEDMSASLMGQIALDAAILLTSPQLERLRVCATSDCDWMFLDTSKNGRRRWCQMSVCGSRAKSQRAARQ